VKQNQNSAIIWRDTWTTH